MNRYPECDKECMFSCSHGNCVRHCHVNRTGRALGWGEHPVINDPAPPVPAVEHQADAYPYSSPDIAAHWPQAPSVRYVEPHREAFIALYEAAQWVAEEREGGRDTIHAAWRTLQGALDKAAPAYGQALVARAEGRSPKAGMTTPRPAHSSDPTPSDACGAVARDKETGGQ